MLELEKNHPQESLWKDGIRSIRAIPNIWSTVFIFADFMAGIIFLNLHKNNLITSIITSLAIRVNPTNPITLSLIKRTINIPTIKNLSAMGSKVFPKELSTDHFRAKYPSRKSVKQQTKKIIPETVY